MITSEQCYKRYGDPKKENNMAVLIVPDKYRQEGKLPKKIYCNKDIAQALLTIFEKLLQKGLLKEIREYNGCFVNRNMRGLKTKSLHSWGLAIDINATAFPLGSEKKQHPELVKIFKECGFDAGEDFHSRKDPMHFQLKEFPGVVSATPIVKKETITKPVGKK